MKIGEFCRRFGVTPSSVRYYVREGLLIPDEKNHQYVFTPSCMTDIALIMELKEFCFTLSEIHETLSLHRISHFAAPEDRRKLKILFYRKRTELEEKRAALEEALKQLEQLKEGAAAGISSPNGDFSGKGKLGIREFSRFCGLPVRTLRYYIQLGLLCPAKSGGNLFFDEKTQEDFHKIEKLKKSSISLDEIGAWLTAERDGALPEEAKRSRKLEIIAARQELEAGKLEHLNTAVRKLEERLSSFQEASGGDGEGFSVEFFSLLCCPNCGEDLNYYGLHIAKNRVMSGSGGCSCGFRLAIENGILTVPEQNAVKGSYIPPTDRNRETYNRMHPDEVNGFQKSFNWVIKQLKQEQLSGKVVFENSVDVVNLLCTGISGLDRDAFYIIADSDYHVICDVRKRIEAGSPGLKILYISAPSLHYPIRPRSVDVLIDFYTSEVLQAANIISLTEGMSAFLKPGAAVVGVYSHVVKGNGTLRNNRRMFPDSYPGRYQLQSFQNALSRSGVILTEAAVINTFDYTSSLPAFEKGDIIGDFAFAGKWSGPTA